jgi:hypothetical protein
VTRNPLTAGRSASNEASYTTASIHPGAKRLALAFLFHAAQEGAATLPSATGNGFAWTVVKTVSIGQIGEWRLTCFRAMLQSVPGVGPVTFTFHNNQIQDFAGWSIVEYDSIDTHGANGESAVVQSAQASGDGFALSVPLGAFGDPTHNWAVGALGLATGTQVIEGQGFSAIDQEIFARGTLHTQDKPGQAAGASWNWTGAAAAAGAIALEIRAAVPAFELARRFEPILYFHREEKFFPSDAKRYLERCALWQAESPFDVKDSWGGKGKPFPRSPMIPSGQIAGVAVESGTFLGSNPDFLRNVTFSNLAGWKNKAGVS